LNSFTQDPKSSFHGKRGKENLFAGLVNLFVGGSETTSSTLNWALFYLAKHPEIQAKAVEEIATKIGHHRLPSLKDRPETPLIEAIVMETHRISALAFSGIPRLVTKDTKLGDYFLPKVNTFIHFSHIQSVSPILWWFDFKLGPIFATALATSKNGARFKSGQSLHENNRLAT
jgi:hypothetical protein